VEWVGIGRKTHSGVIPYLSLSQLSTKKLKLHYYITAVLKLFCLSMGFDNSASASGEPLPSERYIQLVVTYERT
jgi:hypothetical protein